MRFFGSPDQRAMARQGAALVAMHGMTGIGTFSPGIGDDNVPSTRLCEKPGLVGMDPDAFKNARITK